MRGLETVNIMFSIPAHNKDVELKENYRTAATIYAKMKRMMAKEGFNSANKYDVLIRYGIPFYMRTISFMGIKFMPMLAFDSFDDVKRMSDTKNPVSNQPMMETDDLAELAHQLVCANLALWDASIHTATIYHVFLCV